jgi:hypothetical protein
MAMADTLAYYNTATIMPPKIYDTGPWLFLNRFCLTNNSITVTITITFRKSFIQLVPVQMSEKNILPRPKILESSV